MIELQVVYARILLNQNVQVSHIVSLVFAIVSLSYISPARILIAKYEEVSCGQLKFQNV